jgi:predicted GNAT superfamily acetyltransferase
VPEDAPIRIRALETRADFEAAVRLQEATWGEGFAERVPTAILRIARDYGGVAAGAFEGERMVGFVFGLTGLVEGRSVHWSDMLAVLPGWRRRGVGVRLKAWQRDRLLALGVREMRWSFDPLEAGNARLNLNRLGAVGRGYVEDMYGESTSPLHAGVGTDRVIVAWELDRALPDPDAPPSPLPPGAIHVPIPRDLQGLKARDPEEARRRRLLVRAALAPPLREGWELRGLVEAGSDGDPLLVVVPPAPPGTAGDPGGTRVGTSSEHPP